MSDPHLPLAWENLVTEGHVRAARVRRAQPLMIALSVGSMLIGWYLLTNIAPSRTENNREAVLAESVARQQRRALYAFGAMPAPRIGRSRVVASPLASEVSAIQRRILEELNLTGELPQDLPNGLRLVTVEPPRFWRSPWRARALIVAVDSRVIVAGAIVNSGSAEIPIAERWIGVFRRTEGLWEVASIAAPGFVAVPDTPMVAIQDIPITLGPLLYTKE